MHISVGDPNTNSWACVPPNEFFTEVIAADMTAASGVKDGCTFKFHGVQGNFVTWDGPDVVVAHQEW